MIFSVALSRSAYKQSNKPALNMLLTAMSMQFIAVVTGFVASFTSLHSAKCPLPSIFGYLAIVFSVFSIVGLVVSFARALKNGKNADRIAYLITLILYLQSSVGAYFLSIFCLTF